MPAGAPFAGLRVLELATGVAGPYAGKLLCDLGAEVVKLEEPGGDPLRRKTACGQALAPGEDSALFRILNASKRGVVADLAGEPGRRVVLELAERADLVIESFGPGGLEQRGLGVAALRARRPALSVVSVSAWGLDGPWASRPATEFTQQASSGSLAKRALPGRTPVAAAGELGEYAAGAYAAVGGAAAWLSARQTGEGQHVDVSVFEAVVCVLTTFWALRGTWIDGPFAATTEAPSIEPAKDGWVGFCTYTGQQWQDFCALIGRADLARDERFFHASQRFQNAALVQGAIRAWTRERTMAEIIETASLMRIPCAPLLDASAALLCDHFAARGVFVENPHGFRQPRPPYRFVGNGFDGNGFGSAETRPPGRAPALGEHTDGVSDMFAAGAAAEPGIAGSAASRPLEGLRVVDLTAFWAGPVVHEPALADLGADVVKIESIQRPDGIRFVGATGNEPLWEWSEVFHGANPGKRSVTLDLDQRRGPRAAAAARRRRRRDGRERLAARAPELRPRLGAAARAQPAPGAAADAGLGPRRPVARPHRLRGERRAGQRDRLAHRLRRSAAGGARLRPAGRHARRAGAARGARAAARTGEGQLVEVALVEPALNVAAQQVVEWSAYGKLLTREENRGPGAAPQGVYRCLPPRGARDPEFVALAVTSDAQWRGLRAALGEPAWTREAALESEAGRRAAHGALDVRLAAWCAGLQAADAEARLLAAGVPAAGLLNAHFLGPNPQLAHRGFFQTLDHPVTGPTPYPSLPMRFSKWGAGLHRSPPPTLGQHNDEVLGGELGLSADELARLREAKVIGERPAFL